MLDIMWDKCTCLIQNYLFVATAALTKLTMKVVAIIFVLAVLSGDLVHENFTPPIVFWLNELFFSIAYKY